MAGALASENDGGNSTGDQAEAQQREVYWFGHREKVLLFSRGSIPRTTFCGRSSMVERHV